MSCEYVVVRAGANLPQSTTEDIFSASGGKVLVLGVIGKVTSDIQASSTVLNIWAGAVNQLLLVNGANITSQVAGTLIGTALSSNTVELGDAVSYVNSPVVLDDGGVIQANCTSSHTGQVEYTLWYRPLEQGAKVTAA